MIRSAFKDESMPAPVATLPIQPKGGTEFIPFFATAWFWHILAAGLILGSAALHLAYLAHDCPLDLAPDEAHYWDWSRHLDWSYYSKGPLVAYLIRIGVETAGPWSEQL